MSYEEETQTLNQTSLLSRYTSPNHWLTTQNLLEELSEIAQQPIFVPIENKDILFNQFLNTIYCGYFDELHGGLILEKNVSSLEPARIYSYAKKNHLYHKPLAINISLCRLLFASDQVFYHGEFRNVATKILLNIISTLSNHKLYYEYYSEVEQFDCCFDRETLESILKKGELVLFDSLTNCKRIDGQLIYTKTCSLKDAAKKANVEYKKSQIIEHTINQKLTIYSKEIGLTELPIEEKSLDPFQMSCELIEVIGECLSHLDDFNLKKQADNIFATLEVELQIISKTKTNFFSNSLSLICAGISLLTTNFESLLLSKITTLLSDTVFLSNFHASLNFSNSMTLNVEKINYQKDLVVAFITSLPEQFNLPSKLLEITNSEIALKYKFNLVFIEQHSVDRGQQITVLNSKFNALQKIFVYE